jgi:hypothetical protein
VIKASLDDDGFAWFVEKEKAPHAKTIENRAKRYNVALFRLRQAGIKLRAGREETLDIYLKQRMTWDRHTTVRQRWPFSENLPTVPEHSEDGS